MILIILAIGIVIAGIAMGFIAYRLDKYVSDASAVLDQMQSTNLKQ